MAKSKEKKDSFEQSLARLEKIVEELESGELSLDESLARYEEGAKALQACRALLEAAEKRIEMLVKGENGKLTARPFAAGEGDEPENASGPDSGN